MQGLVLMTALVLVLALPWLLLPVLPMQQGNAIFLLWFVAAFLAGSIARRRWVLLLAPIPAIIMSATYWLSAGKIGSTGDTGLGLPIFLWFTHFPISVLGLALGTIQGSALVWAASGEQLAEDR